MTSTRERQRAAARARLAKEMADRQTVAHKRRQRQAFIGAGVALLIVAGGVIWLVSSLGGDDKSTAASDPSAAPISCAWTEVPADQRTPTTKDVGVPPTTTPPTSGNQVMTVDTSFGPVEVTMNLAKSPCTAEAFSFLASKNFWDGTKCHRMFPGMLQCGDPSAKGKGYRDTDGTGGPSFRYANENLPVDDRPAYPEGVVALANSGPDTNGSQFFFIYQDVELSPDYTVLGKVTKGLENIKKATEAGHDGAFDPSPGGGHPKSDIEIKTIKVAAPAA
ncbi:peptidyl-prolyl cis-trans isomerase B (cyclophilin B) [Asanoa ferruginea]|uniref:Peptidyl-prolyl cis-trans isomerase n=1 Tax=Asanoa ferruginea TaxID=53367 RepID=A0A3D9ZQE9_9ACTN|nr:peptidylprolyl isomerase [Asanoa ferruginea]REF98702.1 peptidyl-prolyl cis-trans isomerase B (cyclophilin B) [Asanoa ferruginea]GIF52933.1 peptidyl-prolyl cis-trans isomerase [Asanoa ferruginea]